MNLRHVLAVALLALAGVTARAQVAMPKGTSLSRPSMPLYQQTSAGGSRLDCVITGSSVSNLDAQNALVEDFQLQNFRNGDAKQVSLTARAPQCEVDIANGVLWDSGHLQVYTPTTNLFVEGDGFYFVQSNHFLALSNNVKTKVVKSLLKSQALSEMRPSESTASKNDVVLIFAKEGRFNLDSNVVDYSGDVHLIDPQLDLTSDFLTIRFASNGGVEDMLARHHVVLTTTNNGQATGDIGYYYLTNGVEMMRLSVNAVWRNGDEGARADEFTYDSTRHFLSGDGRVQVRWPNAAPGASDSVIPRVGTNGFRELYADFAAIQFPPSNGPAERMMARGNVMIVNQADHNSATAEQADYEKATDSIELNGNPVWWNTNMEVRADLLSAELGAKTYHAHGHARFKMRTGSAAASTNSWLRVDSEDMEYLADQAIFDRSVEARRLEQDQVRDTLNCNLLTLNIVNNKVESAAACDNVLGETAPDTNGVVKTISCARLNAFFFSETGRVQSLDASTNVVIAEKEAAAAAPFNKLTADAVTARFSEVSNQLEQAVADQNVRFDQRKNGQDLHATGRRAVYTGAGTDEVKLTGNPLAWKNGYVVTNADYLLCKPNSNIFVAVGRYQILRLPEPLARNRTNP